MSLKIDELHFHNVAALEEYAGGYHLFRFPQEVRHALGERGRFIAEESTGCEIRFVTPAPNVRITLQLPNNEGEVAVYKGGILHSMHRLQAGLPTTLHLEEPPRLSMIPREQLLESGFAPEVWRIIFGRANAVLLRLNTFGHPVRPPKPEEMPRLRWLAYGSSITHGLMTYPLSYVDQAARRLQADVSNKGMSGSCLCEKEMADFLAERQDWDVITLELGVNMRDQFTPEAFAERTEYLLKQVVTRHPKKPIFVITVYPNFATQADTVAGERERRYNDILQEQVKALQHPHVYLLDGASVMMDYSSLSADMIHPGSYGHMRMGERLAALMKPVLEHYCLREG
ncbi:SGNH/GDSL hydrolase family protein [Paenibacillus sp. GD4]|uniref:SGNH/GDSL hydrolase family protein n=1 Tax=Paenibacillus sp. GD4 TaxID=3068890 RepID=UPI0027968719|nr:SGNH/GDSL hydrolase family protein [Paenibacillus sp. GD4]MDQ1914108.1 SGNH/GDSL hydrolase family protein [Paenibacillus sp. GD4]